MPAACGEPVVKRGFAPAPTPQINLLHPAPCPAALPACRCSLVVQQAEGNGRFAAELGTPLVAGPWYNSSVAISHDGHVATVTLPVRGSQRSSDVTVRVR